MTTEQIKMRLTSGNGEGCNTWRCWHPVHGWFPMGRTLAEAIEVANGCRWFAACRTFE